MRLLSEKELSLLDEDPIRSFLDFDRLLRQAYVPDDTEPDPDSMALYCAYMEAFIREFGVPLADAGDGEADLRERYYGLRQSANLLIAQYQVRIARQAAQERRRMTLGDDVKLRIYGHLRAVLDAIDALEMEPQTKRSLTSEITRFAESVNADRPDMNRFTEIFFRLAGAMRRGVKNVQPSLDRVEKIAGIMDVARERRQTEAEALPALGLGAQEADLRRLRAVG